jgi:putative nucleotidyltransferase-like protein
VAETDSQPEELLTPMKRAAAALRDAGIPFALAGGLAVWARGGPETGHDVDFLVKPDDARRAQQVLAGIGMRAEDPPEDWLLKVYDGDELIDLIFDPNGGPVDDGWFERADDIEFLAMRMPIASLEDVLTSKLLSLREQEPDFSSVLEMARSVREQVDWDAVRARTQDSAFAKAFFTLVEELGIVPRPRG